MQGFGCQLEELGFYPGGIRSHGRCLSRGGAGLLVRELSLDAMAWAIPDTVEGAEGMPLQNGNMNDDDQMSFRE